jgi:hypothetical protein
MRSALTSSVDSFRPPQDQPFHGRPPNWALKLTVGFKPSPQSIFVKFPSSPYF